MTTITARPEPFDPRALTYLSHVDENLCCPICRSPLLNPKTTKCRHTFCAECIQDALERSPTCPVDRSKLNPEDIFSAPVMVANLVNELTVLCPNSIAGCDKTLPRSLVGGHLKEDCEFVAVECPGCRESILRRDVREECLHNETECPHCAATVIRLELESHISLCPQLTSECPHCTSEFARSYIAEHEATCDEAMVPCGSSSVGCPWSGRRREASDHAAACAFTYLRPLLQEHAQRISALEVENKALHRKLERHLLRSRAEKSEPEGSAMLDDQTIHVLTEQEHLRSDLERLIAAMSEMELKQNMLTMHITENMRTKEEVAMIGAAVNNMRTQLHGLQMLTLRRQTMEQRPGNGNTGQGPAVGGQTQQAQSLSNLHIRRPSESGDRVKL